MPRALVRRFRYSAVMMVIALQILGSAVFWNIDVFQWPGLQWLGIDDNEIGEVAIAFLAIIPALFLDYAAMQEQRKAAELTSDQLLILQRTMRTVQDVVSGSLRQLQLARSEAERSMPDEARRIFDPIIRETTIQLKALGGVVVDSPLDLPALPL